jgi:hypothetical protein
MEKENKRVVYFCGVGKADGPCGWVVGRELGAWNLGPAIQSRIVRSRDGVGEVVEPNRGFK